MEIKEDVGKNGRPAPVYLEAELKAVGYNQSGIPVDRPKHTGGEPMENGRKK